MSCRLTTRNPLRAFHAISLLALRGKSFFSKEIPNLKIPPRNWGKKNHMDCMCILHMYHIVEVFMDTLARLIHGSKHREKNPTEEKSTTSSDSPPLKGGGAKWQSFVEKKEVSLFCSSASPDQSQINFTRALGRRFLRKPGKRTAASAFLQGH